MLEYAMRNAKAMGTCEALRVLEAMEYDTIMSEHLPEVPVNEPQ